MAAMTNEGQESLDSEKDKDFIQVSSNWKIKTGKNIKDTVSTMCLKHAPERMSLDEVVSFETCIALCSNNSESDPCTIDVKLTNNQRIKRIAIVSEATVLEFFKQFGEYATTVFAEFIDEFEDQSVYISETTIEPPTSEASIKFTKTKRKIPEMWLYGIKLILTESKVEKVQGVFDFDVINGFLANSKTMNPQKSQAAKNVLNSLSLQDSTFPSLEMCLGKFATDLEKQSRKTNEEEKSKKTEMDIREYIDYKFQEMEQRLMEKLGEVEERSNRKLDAIIALLESR